MRKTSSNKRIINLVNKTREKKINKFKFRILIVLIIRMQIHLEIN